MRYKKIYEYTVKFKSNGEGGYIVRVPAIPEVVTGGRTLAEAEEMAKEAIALCLRVRVEDGEPIPKDVDYKAAQEPSFFTKVAGAM